MAQRLQNLRASALDVNSSIAALYVHSVDAAGAYVSPGAGSTQVSIKEIQTSSGASVMDSTNASIGVTIRAGSAAGTEYTDGDVDASISGQAILFDNSTNTLRPVTITRGLPVNIVAGSASSTETTVRQSTYTDFNALSRVADRDASTNVANVTNTAPASTAYALAVRQVGFSTTVQVSSLAGKVTVDQNSTVWAVQVDGRVRAQNSTIGDLLASVQQNSTVWAVQLPSSQSFQVKNSTIGDLLASVQQNSTVWQVQAKIQDSSGVSPAVVNSTPSTALQGLVVRPVVNGMNSTTITITSTHSTALYSLVSSVAGARQKVTAYFVGSTHTNPSTFIFTSSNVIDRWAVNFGSGSSGVTGANLAVGAPAWLFNTDAANALQCRIEGGSSVTATVVARVSISWFSEA